MDENGSKGTVPGGAGGIIGGGIFLVWFVLSLVAMIYFSNHGKAAIATAIAGQYFLAFGVIAILSGIKNKTFNPVILIFPLVGIGMIAGGFIYQYGSEVVIAQVEKYLPDLFLVVFLAIGVSLLAFTYLSNRRKKTNCTYVISGTCVDVLTEWHKGHQNICPVYEVYYREETIRLCDHVYTNFDRIEIGERRELNINPDRPTEFYEEKVRKAEVRNLYFLGGTFVAVSLLALYMVHFAK